MIVGNPQIFAIESGIIEAYERLYFRALGFFVIHVNGRSYGRRALDSSMLACSFDEVEKRLAERGRHITPFMAEPDAGRIADAFLNAVYADQQEIMYFDVPLPRFCELFDTASTDCKWAPDGDEAFDDGSSVLQFDVSELVRLIAFKRKEGYIHDPDSLSDMWLPANDFYEILQRWHDLFEAEWAAAKKIGI
jgi:hypothetical protein